MTSYPTMSDVVQDYVKTNIPNANPCYELAGVLLALEIGIADALAPDTPLQHRPHWQLMHKTLQTLRNEWETVANATLS